MATPSNDGNIVKRTSQYLDNLGHDDATGGKGVALYGTPDGTNIYRLKVNSDGSLNVTGLSVTASTLAKPTDAYSISNIESDATYSYYGYEDKDGAWYIMRKTEATGVFLYAAGASGYSSAWTGKAGQSYASYATTF